ncbi:MAG: AbrB/MazE/SpoVT family DNA-binding domain-containing protein [Alkalibacterium sp.]|nr:AbrB/MazE/SpoVT family DNA-binding domain-containing protein [Alkalibacterium sp.]
MNNESMPFYTADKKSPDGTVKISKWGNSQAIRLSKDELKKAGFIIEEELNMYVVNNRIILEKQTTHQTLEERFAHYEGDYKPEEWDSGDSQGAEIF